MTTNFSSDKLLDAIRADRLTAVINALDDGADIEAADMHGYPGLPLRTACYLGNLTIVRELLALGANPSAAAGDGTSAPLRLAMRRQHKEIAALLLKAGAEIPDDLDITPDILEITPQALPGELPIPHLPETSNDNIIEFTPSPTSFSVPSADDFEDFGTATNALSTDLLFLDEDHILDLEPRPEKPSSQS